MTCPHRIGCGGARCKNCLKDVDLSKCVVLYSERPNAFKIHHDKVVITACSGGR